MPLEFGARYLSTQAAGQVICAGLLLILIREKNENFNNYPLWGISLFWIFTLLISFFVSENRLASLEEIMRNVMYVSIALSVFSWAKTEDRVKLISYLIIAVGSFISLTSLWIFLSDYLNTGMFEPAYGSFSRTNDLGAYLLLIFPISFSNFLYENNYSKQKLIYGLSSVLSFSVIIITFSRGIWITLIFALMIIFILGRKTIKKNIVYLIPVVSLCLLPLILKWESIVQRFLSLQNIFLAMENSIEWRKSLLKGTFNIFIDHPVIGTGINSFANVFTQYQQRPGYFSINPHNYYLQLLAETGITGFLVFIVLAISIIYLSIKAFLNAEDIFKGISLGLLTGIIASLIHISLDIDWSVSAIPILFWLQVGLLMSIYRLVGFKDTRFYQNDNRFKYIKKPIIILMAFSLISIPTLNYYSFSLYNRALSDFEINDLENASSNVKLAIKISPWPSAKHHGLFSKILKIQGNDQESLKMISKAIILDRNNYLHYKDYAYLVVKLNSEEKEKALESLKTAVKLNPFTHPSLYEDVGDFYLNVFNENDSVIDWYQKALKVFDLKYLPSYEKYTPDDRYQLYRINKKLASLFNESDPIKAKKYYLNAEYLLKTEPKVKSGELGRLTSTLTGSLKNYWREINNQANVDFFVAPDSSVIHPDNKYFYEIIEIVNIENKIFKAKIEYKVLIHNGNSKKEFQILDSFSLTDNGWLLYSRNIIKVLDK